MTFKDHFSNRAASYAAFRPDYPDALIDFVASLVPRHDVAWDCATGTGQAAVALANHFQSVIATDASAAQLEHARPHPRVEYRVALAEASELSDRSVDLITVAQALHWFDIPRFWDEARRVMRADGAIAVWTYLNPEVPEAPLADAALQEFNFVTLARYWPVEREYVVAAYRTISFPFEPLAVPELTLELQWTLPELVGYLRSWSAVGRYVAAHGDDPVPAVERALALGWGDPDMPRVVRWPMALLAGRLRSGE